ncbi:MAG TPA: cytochrome C [Persephonella sp.]|uniref:CytoChrome c-551 (Cytochrome c551) (Cytochrome C8) n=1 Tax=Persephonella marina (strain DSM 14350 / EX-H1) TaxID=123214 RepID=C0QPY9_PERMH|nr:MULTISPECIES: c-type cytochrome [Persephonella]ACO03142.1 cytoChrome c-551 (Cytochrome c551) (Cytochrome C8) [Persephonella marina EX-H1]HCB69650.1 cytochrome C [Persephonella sp.]
MGYTIYLILLVLLTLTETAISLDGKDLFIRYNCGSCHAPDRKVVGPSFLEISKRYGKSEKAIEKVAYLIINPKPSNWPGYAYMPPFKIPLEHAKALARYVLIDSLKEIEKRENEKNLDDILDDEFQFH